MERYNRNVNKSRKIMKIRIKGTNIKLSQSLKDYVEDKISSVEKFINTKFETQVDFEIEKTTHHHKKGDIFRAEVNLTIPGKLLRAEAQESDIYLSINGVKDKLQRELKKYKDKKSAFSRRSKR